MSSYIGHGKAQVSPEGRGGLQQVISRQPQVLAVGQPLVIADVVGLVLTGRELGPETWGVLRSSVMHLVVSLMVSPISEVSCWYVFRCTVLYVPAPWQWFSCPLWLTSVCWELRCLIVLWVAEGIYKKKKRTLHKWIQPQEKRAKQILQVDFFQISLYKIIMIHWNISQGLLTKKL